MHQQRMLSIAMEERVGISGYLTSTPAIGGRIKAAVEDFVVEEVPLELPASDQGRFLLVRVTSRNWETNRLVRELSRRLGISRRRIHFAGTKDKRAITTQRMTFADVEAEAVRRVTLKDVTLEPMHRTMKRLELGDLLGNRFRIRLRDASLSKTELLDRLRSLDDELREAGGFPNFFGPQRFGESRPISHLVGRALVRGDIRNAVEMYIGHPEPEEPEDSYEARRAFEESRDVTRALKEYPRRLSFERALLNHLRQRPGDYEGALRQLPLNLLTLFIYAYQAFLFNIMLSKRLQSGLGLNEPLTGDLVLPMDRKGLPLRHEPVEVTGSNINKIREQVRAGKAWVSGLILGYETPYAGGKMGELERETVSAEGVKPEDFTVPAMPRLSSRGLRREVLAPLMEFTYRVERDVLLSFRLNPGCYATVLLREFTKGGSP